MGKIITSETVLPEPGPGSINTRTITNSEDVNPEKVSDAMHSVCCNSDSSHAGFCLKTWTSIRIHLPEGILPIPQPTGTRTSGRPGSSVETLEETLLDLKRDFWCVQGREQSDTTITRPFAGFCSCCNRGGFVENMGNFEKLPESLFAMRRNAHENNRSKRFFTTSRQLMCGRLSWSSVAPRLSGTSLARGTSLAQWYHPIEQRDIRVKGTRRHARKSSDGAPQGVDPGPLSL
ncbi:hypothetical protein EYF80_056433 [Liparis tanakae]|uniref:Uncharacterized protein n=1 Tax=Liparis tanakae TaxID=230148 RepID=A0A4Z2EX53_9TELE|nr:hypothetical protein EYF80_056433 [Liparis tanakae]